MRKQTEYQTVSDYAKSGDMRLSRDPVAGFWLHYDGSMRFVRFLSDVRVWVDWINSQNSLETAYD